MSTCNRCRQDNEKSGANSQSLPTYIGETSRTLMICSNQHRKDCERIIKMDTEQLDRWRQQQQQLNSNGYSGMSSWMWDHHQVSHKQENKPLDPTNDFKFEIIKKHTDAMTRQVMEACKINQALDKRTITDLNNMDSHLIPLNRRGEHFAPRSRKKF